MPELPEVEWVVRALNRRLPGQTIRSVEIHRSRTVRPDSPEVLVRRLTGARFDTVRRRGKYLVFHLSHAPNRDAFLIAAHLGMTGRMEVVPATSPRPDHSVVTLHLEDRRFDFSDPRVFGRFSLDTAALEELGPEPLSRAFTPAVLEAALAGSRSAVKVCLLDQARLAGVGNIYASEALFRAGIAPDRPAGQLDAVEIRRLHQSLQKTLRDAIQAASDRGKKRFYYDGGSTTTGQPSRFRVYDRAALPCPDCGTPIRRTVQAGRSTYHCPSCQVSPPAARERA